MPKAGTWTPGISGNPKGRPPIRSIEQAMRQKLKKHYSQFAEMLIDVSLHAETPSGGPDYAVRVRAAEIILRVANGTATGRAAQKTQVSSVTVEEETNGSENQDPGTASGTIADRA